MILVIICDNACIYEIKFVILHADLFSAAKVVKKYDLTKYFAAKAYINH